MFMRFALVLCCLFFTSFSEDVYEAYVKKVIAPHQLEIDLEDGTGIMTVFLVSGVPAILDERFNERVTKRLQRRLVSDDTLIKFKSLSINSKFQHIGLIYIGDKKQSLNEELISRGVLRYKKSQFHKVSFAEQESKARKDKLGMWESGVEVSKVYAQKKLVFLKSKIKKIKAQEDSLKYKLQPFLRSQKLKKEEIAVVEERLEKANEKLNKIKRNDSYYSSVYRRQKEKVNEVEQKLEELEEELESLEDDYASKSKGLEKLRKELESANEEGKALSKLLKVLE